MTHEHVRALSEQWAEAEQRGDVAALDALLIANFVAVGPRSFILDRQQWLDRYNGGSLRNEAFSWEDIAVREYGETVIAVGIQAQRGTYQGHDTSGRFRLTLVAVRQEGCWHIASLHLSGPLPNQPAGRDSSAPARRLVRERGWDRRA